MEKNRKFKFLIMILFFVIFPLAFITADVSDDDSAKVNKTVQSLVYIMDISGPIGTVTADRVIEAVELVEDEMADLLLITMDTPGGLMLSEWDITKAIMNSRVPVAVYVAPVGARAGSAGVFVCYSAHVSAMAPATNIGAAHAVSMSGEMDSVMNEKVQNDAVASIRAMAERYGRNADWAEKAVRKSASITCQEALRENVIDLIADDIDDLLEKIDGREVKTILGMETIKTHNAVKISIKKTFIQSFLDIISSPNIIFILFSLGGLGLTMELYNPGSIFPGVVGAICIILAFYGMRTLPINYAGVLLILLSILLFIMEIKIVSHGLLTIGGVVSLILGGIMLIDTADPELKISKAIIFSVALTIGAFVTFAFWFAYKARISQPTTGGEGLVGLPAVVKRKIDKSGYVYLAGELWEALAEEVIDEGEEVVVLEVDNLKLKVKRKS